MTPDKQRVSIAEAVGWTEITYTGISWQGIGPKDSKRYGAFRPAPSPDENDAREWHWLPDYLNDLNACHSMEKHIPDDLRQNYYINLGAVANNGGQSRECATAAQRCEAFLRTINLWT